MTQPHLFDGELESSKDVVRKTERPKTVPLSARPNPMLAVAGPYEGPELPDPAAGKGRTRPVVCGDCRFLVWKGGHSRRYYGCEKRGRLTNGPATDHLVGWAACGLFDQATPEDGK